MDFFSTHFILCKREPVLLPCCIVTSRALTFGTWMMDGLGMWVQSAITSWLSSLAANTDASVVAGTAWAAVWLLELLLAWLCFSERLLPLNISSLSLSPPCLMLLAATADGCRHTAEAASVFSSSMDTGPVLGCSNGVFSCVFPKQVSRAEQGKGCILDDRLSDPLSLLSTAA